MLLNQRSPIRWAYSFDEKHSAWIVPKWMFPEDFYPDYIAGLGYVLLTRFETSQNQYISINFKALRKIS